MTTGYAVQVALLITLVSGNAFAGVHDDGAVTQCNSAPDATRVQYIIGYGSLMEDASRERTAPHAGPARPVVVTGFARGWYSRSKGPGLGTTYLGVVEDVASSLNAVMYEVEAGELAATDRRERSYCRVPVNPSAVKLLSAVESPIAKAQIWIYEIRAGDAAPVDEEHPIVQSYVDIFLAGCLEQEERYKLQEFSLECVRTTHGWSAYWVNDRVYPRRPFVFQPRAPQIDKLLSEEVPAHWSKLQLEGGDPRRDR